MTATSGSHQGGSFVCFLMAAKVVLFLRDGQGRTGVKIPFSHGNTNMLRSFHPSRLRLLRVNDVQHLIRVHLRVQQAPPHTPQKHIHLLRRPAQAVAHRPQRDRLQPVHRDRLVVRPDLFQQRVARPRPQRHLERALVDAREPGALELGRDVVHAAEVDRHGGQPSPDELQHAREGEVGRHGAVVAARRVVHLVQLDPAAGAEVPGKSVAMREAEGGRTELVGLGEHALVVAERLDRVARVDEVEVAGRVHPLRLGVVDHEFDVGGRPGRLDGAEVDALDEGAWVLLAHLGNVRLFFLFLLGCE